MRAIILNTLKKVALETECSLIPEINDNTVLLESGLDSLGFAILVASLEEELGTDPFSLMDGPVYPRTFGEFVRIYEEYQF